MLIEIYSRTGCNACDNAKKILNELNLSFVEYKVDLDISKDDLIMKYPGARMLPVIIVDGRQVQNINEFQLLNEG